MIRRNSGATYWRAATPDRAATPSSPLDVPTLAAALQELWRTRDAQDHLVYDIPVPPDEQTARALASVYARLSSHQEGDATPT